MGTNDTADHGRRQPQGRGIRPVLTTGLAIMIPATVTVYFVVWVVTEVDAMMRPLLPEWVTPDLGLGRDIPGFGLVVFVLATTLIGAMARSIAGRRIRHLTHGLFDRLPVVRTVYNAIRQFAETLLERSDGTFTGVCLIEFPERGRWMIAFETPRAAGEIGRGAGRQDLVTVFMPTAPNPTTGFLLSLPRQDARPLGITVEEGFRIIVSGGLVTPETVGAAHAA